MCHQSIFSTVHATSSLTWISRFRLDWAAVSCIYFLSCSSRKWFFFRFVFKFFLVNPKSFLSPYYLFFILMTWQQGRAIRIGYCIGFTIFLSIGFTQYLLCVLLISQYNTIHNNFSLNIGEKNGREKTELMVKKSKMVEKRQSRW